MLSYRHAYHAGNHADVLKHCVLTLVIDYLKQKEKPLLYIDTHAGAGAYDFNSTEAKKNAEFARGIERVVAESDNLPEMLATYLQMIGKFRNTRLGGYPGSPWLAANLLREQDRLRLFEMHPQDFLLLQEALHDDRRVLIESSDGFSAMKAALPPPSRRALVLIDPPYELKDDYTRVVAALNDGLRRFATGTYLIWYPLLPRAESKKLPQQLRAVKAKALCVELQIDEPQGEFGMYGSGMYIVNPPWTLRQQMQILLPIFARLLGSKTHAAFSLEAIEY